MARTLVCKFSISTSNPTDISTDKFIYLLNPAHMDFSRAVQLGKGVDVFLDPRLWRRLLPRYKRLGCQLKRPNLPLKAYAETSSAVSTRALAF
jgi:hypothetical protein